MGIGCLVVNARVSAETMSLPDRLFKRLERELVKAKARQRADKKAAARRMRRITSSHLAETSPSDVLEGVKETPIINPISEQPEELSLSGVRLALMPAKPRSTKAERQKTPPSLPHRLSRHRSPWNLFPLLSPPRPPSLPRHLPRLLDLLPPHTSSGR